MVILVPVLNLLSFQIQDDHIVSIDVDAFVADYKLWRISLGILLNMEVDIPNIKFAFFLNQKGWVQNTVFQIWFTQFYQVVPN
jgi:hypothetical protein